MNQYWIQSRLDDDNRKHWRRVGKATCEALAADLKQRGLSPEAAPEMPPLHDGLQGVTISPFRILSMWIPFWSSNPDAGHFVVRVDTLAREVDLQTDPTRSTV